jgi:hypothetical protein
MFFFPFKINGLSMGWNGQIAGFGGFMFFYFPFHIWDVTLPKY